MRQEAPPIFQHTHQCLVRGCYKRIPMDDWFCREHQSSGVEYAIQAIREIKEQQAFADWMRESGLVYVYALGSGDRVKFGQTKNLMKRISAIRTSSPVAVELLASVVSRTDLEKKIHRHLAADRLHGEWFTRSQHVERILELFEADDDQPLRNLLIA